MAFRPRCVILSHPDVDGPYGLPTEVRHPDDPCHSPTRALPPLPPSPPGGGLRCCAPIPPKRDVCQFERYDKILFVGGGIGVTPLHSSFRCLYQVEGRI